MIGDTIRQYRKANQMSQDDLAEKLNVTRQSVSLWENGQTQPSLDSIVAMAQLFQVSTDTLLTASEADLPDGAEPTADAPQEPTPKKKKRWILPLIAAVLVLAVVCVLGVTSAKQKAAEQAKAESEEQQAQIAAYYDAMKSLTYAMLDGSVEAEKAGNLIQNVWHNAIFETSDAATDPYTKPNGIFVSDFNEALNNLMSDETFAAQIATMQEHRQQIVGQMKQLKNPPEQYKEAYDTLQAYYKHYIAFVDLTASPAGSLNEFSDKFGAADTDTVAAFRDMELYFD